MVTEPFHRPARLNAEAMGVPGLPLVILPHPVGDLPPAELEKLAAAAYPAILAALTAAGAGRRDFPVDYRLPGAAGPTAACDVCVE